MSMYDNNHYNIVISLQLKKKKLIRKKSAQSLHPLPHLLHPEVHDQHWAAPHPLPPGVINFRQV